MQRRHGLFSVDHARSSTPSFHRRETTSTEGPRFESIRVDIPNRKKRSNRELAGLIKHFLGLICDEGNACGTASFCVIFRWLGSPGS